MISPSKTKTLAAAFWISCRLLKDVFEHPDNKHLQKIQLGWSMNESWNFELKNRFCMISQCLQNVLGMNLSYYLTNVELRNGQIQFFVCQNDYLCKLHWNPFSNSQDMLLINRHTCRQGKALSLLRLWQQVITGWMYENTGRGLKHLQTEDVWEQNANEVISREMFLLSLTFLQTQCRMFLSARLATVFTGPDANTGNQGRVRCAEDFICNNV